MNTEELPEMIQNDIELRERHAFQLVQDIARMQKSGGGAAAKAWVPYEGPLGGKGWKDTDTDEVRYQEDKPAGRGGESTASALDRLDKLETIQTINTMPTEDRLADSVNIAISKTGYREAGGTRGSNNADDLVILEYENGQKDYARKIEQGLSSSQDEETIDNLLAPAVYDALGVHGAKTSLAEGGGGLYIVKEGIEGKTPFEMEMQLADVTPDPALELKIGANINEAKLAALVAGNQDAHDANLIMNEDLDVTVIDHDFGHTGTVGLEGTWAPGWTRLWAHDRAESLVDRTIKDELMEEDLIVSVVRMANNLADNAPDLYASKPELDKALDGLSRYKDVPGGYLDENEVESWGEFVQVWNECVYAAMLGVVEGVEAGLGAQRISPRDSFDIDWRHRGMTDEALDMLNRASGGTKY